MSYHTIAVHADLSPHAESRLRLACAVAASVDAHLIGVACTGLAGILADGGVAAHKVRVLQGERIERQAERALAQFAALAGAAGLRSFAPRLLPDDAEDALSTVARCCDLVVLSQSDPDATVPGADLAAWVVLHGARPVLVAPRGAGGWRLDGHAVLAWNGSAAAARATRDALPLLRRAARVTVAHLGSLGDPAFGAEAADLRDWLGRHGIQPTLIDRLAGTRDGDALLALAHEQGADLIVMGADGHARVRELVLGGITRHMLQNTSVPLLMSH